MPSSSKAVAAAAVVAPILPSTLYTATAPAAAPALATEDELLEQLICQSSMEDGGNGQSGTNGQVLEEMARIYLNRRK